jgi:hypothetical protein
LCWTSDKDTCKTKRALAHFSAQRLLLVRVGSSLLASPNNYCNIPRCQGPNILRCHSLSRIQPRGSHCWAAQQPPGSHNHSHKRERRASHKQKAAAAAKVAQEEAAEQKAAAAAKVVWDKERERRIPILPGEDWRRSEEDTLLGNYGHGDDGGPCPVVECAGPSQNACACQSQKDLLPLLTCTVLTRCHASVDMAIHSLTVPTWRRTVIVRVTRRRPVPIAGRWAVTRWRAVARRRTVISARRRIPRRRTIPRWGRPVPRWGRPVPVRRWGHTRRARRRQCRCRCTSCCPRRRLHRCSTSHTSAVLNM